MAFGGDSGEADDDAHGVVVRVAELHRVGERHDRQAILKNATNDIKSEIQKGAEANGFDAKSLSDMTGNITSEINKAKDNLLGDTSQFTDITGNITSEINKAKDSLLADTTAPIETTKEVIEDITGPIKRQM